jgi:hypothetical protein
VKRERDRSWLKERRVIVFGIGCALAGFLVALLIFGDPWHLPPNWGDIPTWLAVFIAGVGGWIALSQLRQQQKVIEDDFARGRKRDELLDRQLDELNERARYMQRDQAEGIKITAWKVHLPDPAKNPAVKGDAAGGKKEERTGFCKIANESRRPVRRVACRLILDWRELRAGRFSTGSSSEGHLRFPANAEDVDIAAGEYLHLLSERSIGAGFLIPDDIVSYQNSRYVIRFTDDAERRWELDGDMRLTLAPDNDW